MTDFLPVISGPYSDRQRYSHAFKRQIVEATMVSGASIAGVALAYGINTNLLHKWRSRYRHGEYGTVADTSILPPVRLPAHVRTSKAAQPNYSNQIASLANSIGHIELFVKETRVLIHGTPDCQTLRNVIEALCT
jgi:transposase